MSDGRQVKCVVVLVLLLIAIGLNATFSKPDFSLSRKQLAEFPRAIGDWKAVKEYQIDAGSMKILQVDDYIIRDYVSSKGDRVGLYIGYFKSQQEGKGIHSPRQCLPGAGWMPVSTADYHLFLKKHNPESVTINKYILGKGLEEQLFLFWYQGRGRIYAGEFWNKLYLLWDGMTKKRTDGALIRINNAITGSQEEAMKTQIEFIRLAFPLFAEFIPE